MTALKTLLLATDFSEGSVAACAMARMLSELSGARLHVLHVVTEVTDRSRRHLPVELVQNFVREVESLAEQNMKTFVATHLSGLPVESEVLVGDGWQDIVRRAAETGVDLIVIATHGKSGLERLLVGSTTERVLRHSQVPVLTVRA
ncbi:MAG TPA: universal stress protein [Rubrivivax sp.]|nr:universal stress protein [Rubrivivax sp.]